MKYSLGLSLVFTLLLGACGQPYCIVGLGDCEKMYRGAGQAGVGVGGKLTVSTLFATTGQTASTITTRDQITLKASGGTTPYFCSVNPPDCGTASCDTPTAMSFTPKQPGKCEITIKDSSPVTQVAYAILNIVGSR